MNTKQIIVSAGIVLGFMAVLVGGILIIDSVKPKKNTVEDEMTSMHAPPPPADNARFQSLLNNQAPDFKLKSYDGGEISLSDFNGKNVVLFFSEGAMCYPSCWDQIKAFQDDKKLSDVVVLTIVVDSKTDWDGVVKKDPKLNLPNILLDSDRKVSKDYGVLKLASSMHRGQFPGHTYIIIDKEGVVRSELDDPNMGINNEKLLSYISDLIKQKL